MGVIDKLAARLGYHKPRARGTGGYAAADFSRLTASLQSEAQFINTTLRFQLRTLRARSRQAAQNNPFARRFAQMVVDNVCGPEPFRLEGQARYKSGDFDTGANKSIEDCWKAWGRAGNCEITGKWSWNAVQRVLIRGLAVDGEILLRKLKGPDYGPHGYQLQIIDVDRLYEFKNAALDGGGAIHAGVEVDAVGRPQAYHLLKRKPSQWQYSGYTFDTERVPAEEMIHVFVPEFAEQVRGVPWMYAALLHLVHMGEFELSAVIAARMGAEQMGFIQMPDGDLAPIADSKTATGEPQFQSEAGTFRGLPPGATIAGWNPKYPDAAVEPFIKACLRGIASGMGVAYHNLANDLEGVNYSSARIGELDERDTWMTIQSFVAEHLHQPLYENWLQMQILTGKLTFDIARLDKYRDVYWQARRWAWVDPLKEVGAAIEAMNANTKSHTRIVAEGGDNFEDVLKEIAADRKMALAMGIDLTPIQPKATGIIPDAQGAGDGTTDGTTDGTGKKKGREWDPELKETLALIRKLAERPPAPINVDARSTHTNTVNVPEQPAAQVKVDVAPSTVHVAAPQVNVRAYPRESTEKIERDADKEITTVRRTNKD